MQYLKMLPYQVREAIDNHYPVVLPLGVIEYHAEHLPLGVDCFVAIEAIERMERRNADRVVILPPFYYGTASNAVADPARNGTVNVDSKNVEVVAEDILRGLLEVGFRNIHCFIAHQGEEFEQGMPTDLAFRFAGRRVVFDYLEKNAGRGWWGTEKFSNYYSGNNNPFAWIQVHGVCTRAETRQRFTGDHAGKMETSATMCIHPECVHMERLDNSLWYSRPAKDADAALGDAYLEALSQDVEYTTFGGK